MSDIQPTEHDHHEQQTALEAALRNGLAWLSANLTAVIYGVAAILAIAAVVVFLQRKPTGNVEASTLLLVASTPEEYQDIADSAPTSLLGQWSRLRQGDRLLDNAVTNMFTDRAQGLEDLQAAKDAYENLGNQSGLNDDLRERVVIGLARVAECECDGSEASVKAVEKAWNQVLDAFPDSIMKGHAEDRIARLKQPETADFYKWFAKLDPKPALPGMGPGSVPEIPDGLLPNDFPGAAPAEMPSADDPASDAGTATSGTATSDAEETPEKAAETETDKQEPAAKTEEPQPEPAETKAAPEKQSDSTEAKTEPSQEAKPAETTTEEKPVKAVEEAAESKTEAAKTDGDN